MKKRDNVLIIYTGGTIGMCYDEVLKTLKPFDFDNIAKRVPEINQFPFGVKSISFSPVIDSADMQPSVWVKIAEVIEENYNEYLGFVVLHGTDTMSYSASALSFMLHNLKKPVIFTGSQLPIDTIRNDGKENLITSLEIAGSYQNGEAIVQEVALYFQDRLYRGNRTTKINADQFEAFHSANYPPLATVGIEINFNYSLLWREVQSAFPNKFWVTKELDSNIGIIKFFPGITIQMIAHILSNPSLKGVVLETYGSGNSPNIPGLTELFKEKIEKGMVLLNITQCLAGSVSMEQYASGKHLLKAGVISGGDMSIEAAVVKLMYLLAISKSRTEVESSLVESLKGEKKIVF